MSAWKDLVTTSLLGTEKSGATPVLPAALGDVLGPAEKLDAEARFLTRAGALALWRRAGRKPVRVEVVLPAPSPPENTPPLNPTSTAHLRAMLGGHCADVLPEWLGEVARLGKRVPPELLPALLEWACLNRARRPLAAAAGGERTHWLATLNPAWNFAADNSPEHWETGGREQRVAILRGWRATDPVLARGKLAAIWNTESADTRTALLETWEESLSIADAEFLERALDDRSKEVRRAAVDLLARLPDTPFAARMTVRAAALLKFKPGGLLKRASFEVTLPGEPDAPARRDGLDAKILDAPRTMGGEKTAILAHTLASVPLRHWTDTFQQGPEVLLATAARHPDFAAALVTGWGLATVRQRAPAWANALFNWPLAPNAHLHLVRHDALFRVLPAAEQIKRLFAAARAAPLKFDAQPFEGGHWPAYFMYLAESATPLPDDLALLAVGQLRQLATDAPAGVPYHLRGFAETVALKTPTALLAEASEDWPVEKPPVASVVERLAFRRDALAALTQP